MKPGLENMGKLLKVAKRVTDLAHVVGGYVTGKLILVEPLLGILLAVAFYLYEFAQAWKGKNGLVGDLREYAVGLYVAGLEALGIDVIPFT